MSDYSVDPLPGRSTAAKLAIGFLSALIIVAVMAQGVNPLIDYVSQLKNKPFIGLSDTMIPVTYKNLNALCAAATLNGIPISINTQITGTKVNSTSAGFTCSAPLQFNSGGSIQPASGQAISGLSPQFVCGSYQPCFDTSKGGSFTFSGTVGPMNPNWLGADWTGTKDSLAAFNAAYAAGVNVVLVPGTYTLSNTFTMPANTSSLVCSSAVTTIIQYQGTSNINDLITISGNNGTLIQGCGFRGNQYITLGVIYQNGQAGNTLRDVQFYDFVQTQTTSPNAAVYFTNGNTNTLENVICTGSYYQNGIILNSEFNDTIIKPKIEEIGSSGVPGYGIWLNGGSGITTIGGTSEGILGTGFYSTAFGSTTIGLDLEVDTVYFVDGGLGNTYIATGGDFTFLAAAREDTVMGGSSFNNMTVNSGARGISIVGSSYNGSGNANWITDNGTCTTFSHIQNNNGHYYYPDRQGCQSGTNINGGINRFTEVLENGNSNLNISAATCTGGVITYTAGTYALAPNFSVTITGAAPSGYNVSALPITVIDGTHFSVSTGVACPASYSSGGAITGSANNALVVQLQSAADGFYNLMSCPTYIGGGGLDTMPIIGYLTHSLQAGTNTLNFCGLFNVAILTPHGGQLGATRSVGDQIQFAYDSGGAWIIQTAASTAY